MTGFDWRLLLILVPAGAGMLGQRRVRSVFARYAKVPNSTGLSGEETATELLARHSMSDVTVERVPGAFSDHYDSDAKLVRLSEDVARGRSITSLGIASHEVAHAVQDTESSRIHGLRRQVGERLSRLTPWTGLFLIGGLVIGIPVLTMLMGAFLLGMAVFAAVTLPVELTASRHAITTLERYGLAAGDELPGVRRVLQAAAFTYVANLAHRVGIVLFLLLGALAARSVA